VTRHGVERFAFYAVVVRFRLWPATLVAVAIAFNACAAGAAGEVEARLRPPPSATPSPSPAPPPTKFGLLVTNDETLMVWSEIDHAPIASLPRVRNSPIGISADRRRIAYWATLDDGSRTLRVYDIPTATTRDLLPLGTGLSGSALAWSAHGDAVLAQVETLAVQSRRCQEPPAMSRIHLVDLTTGRSQLVHEIARVWLRPIGFEGSAALVEERFPGTCNFPPGRGLGRPDRLFTLKVDREGHILTIKSGDLFRSTLDRDVQGGYELGSGPCANSDACVRVFPLGRPDDATELRPPTGKGLPFAALLPGTAGKVVVLVSDLYYDARSKTGTLEIWEAAGARRTVKNVPRPGRMFVRSDGNAVLLFRFESVDGGDWSGELIDLRTGRSTPYSGKRGLPLASVALN
jgi:hypothetical protein